jgi:hypothetical protein
MGVELMVVLGCTDEKRLLAIYWQAEWQSSGAALAAGNLCLPMSFKM